MFLLKILGGGNNIKKIMIFTAFGRVERVVVAWSVGTVTRVFAHEICEYYIINTQNII